MTRYLHAKQVMTVIAQGWRVYLGKDASQPPPPWEHIEIELELVIHYLQVRCLVLLMVLDLITYTTYRQMSSKLSSNTLFSDFNDTGVYKLLVDILVENSALKPADSKQVRIKRVVSWLWWLANLEGSCIYCMS